jgi:hypothetical protein
MYLKFLFAGYQSHENCPPLDPRALAAISSSAAR